MKRLIPWLMALVLAGVAAGVGLWLEQRGAVANEAQAERKSGTQAVRVAAVVERDMQVWAEVPGTVLPSATVTINSQVDGVLARVHFREGDAVKAGDLLVEIDPRPFEVALAEARGQLARAQALLDNARTDLVRYQTLLAKDAGSRQQVDTQVALIGQYQGELAMHRAAVEAAALRLSWTRISAPVSGRIGLRRMDAGNLIKAQGDADGGIALITRMNPARVQFALPQIQALSLTGSKAEVQIWDADRRQKLASSRDLLRDNQIDSSTGTLRMAAQINGDALLANQFVQVRVLLQTLSQQLAVPATAIQHNGAKTQVFKLGEENRVKAVPVRVGVAEGDWVAIEGDLVPADRVVIDGLDRLKEGARVKVTDQAKPKTQRP